MSKRLEKLRSALEKQDVDAIFVESEANRRYLSGFSGTAGALFITKTEAYLVTDFRYVEQAKKQCPSFDIVDSLSRYDSIGELASKTGIKTVAFEKDHITYTQYEWLKNHVKAELLPVSDIVENIRLIKDEEEIRMLKKAAVIADEAFLHVTKQIKSGMTEREIRDELEFFMRKQGADGSSFDIIVASGWRSALPHGVASEKKIEKGELVTMDFGAYYQGYCSDITRTVAIGEPSPQLKEIYDIVYDAQIQAVNTIGPNMTGKEADEIARQVIEEKGFGSYFGHSLGHGLGMEVHERPRLSKNEKTVLQPGMVVTVEPGIYVPDVGGTRIEDDIVITENGNERLTTSTKELIIIEN